MPYTISNLVRRELAGDFADDSSYVVNISNFNEGFPGLGMDFLEAQGAGCLGAWLGNVKGQPCCYLRLKREVPLCQHKPKVISWVGRKQRVCTKWLGKGAPSFTNVHKT